MPREQYKSVTVRKDLYEKIKTFIDEHNKKLGYNRFRSVSHFSEEAIGRYLKVKELEEEK